MTRPDFSRYAVVSRRAALTGALGAARLAVAACSNDAALAGAGSSSPATALVVGLVHRRQRHSSADVL